MGQEANAADARAPRRNARRVELEREAQARPNLAASEPLAEERPAQDILDAPLTRAPLVIDPGALLDMANAPEALGRIQARFDNAPLPRATIEKAQAELSAGTLRGPGARESMAVLEAALTDPDVTVVSKTLIGKVGFNTGEHVNAAYLVELSNGLWTVWKPKAHETREELRDQIRPGFQSVTEEAVYLVDRAMGHLAGVPPALTRTLEGEAGVLMAFVKDASPVFGRLPVDADYRNIALLDSVVGNVDRHRGNLLEAQGHKVPIDHGLSLPAQNGDQGWHNYLFGRNLNLNDAQRAALDALEAARPQLAKDFRRLGLTDAALAALYDRVADMKRTGQIRSRSWRD